MKKPPEGQFQRIKRDQMKGYNISSKHQTKILSSEIHSWKPPKQ